jgi:hypothetical protein
MEGGFDMKAFLTENKPFLGRALDLLNLAMMLETQSLDLIPSLCRQDHTPRH